MLVFAEASEEAEIKMLFEIFFFEHSSQITRSQKSEEIFFPENIDFVALYFSIVSSLCECNTASILYLTKNLQTLGHFLSSLIQLFFCVVD